MPIELLVLVPLTAAAAAGVYILTRGRQPCPHCQSRGPRTSRPVNERALVLRPGDLIYECDACHGAMRYARGPNRREYWEPVLEIRESV